MYIELFQAFIVWQTSKAMQSLSETFLHFLKSQYVQYHISSEGTMLQNYILTEDEHKWWRHELTGPHFVTQNTDELCLHADEPLKPYGRCEKKEADHLLMPDQDTK